jgi:hypothetical protein
MADHLERGKPVAVDGAPVGELFGCFEDDDTLVEQLRQRAAYVGISYNVIEELTGLGEGAVGKYLSPLRVKKITIASLMRLAAPLGLKALLVVDDELVRRMSRHWDSRDARMVHTKRKVRIGKAQLRRVLFEVARELGRRGGIARMKKLSPEQRRLIAKRAIEARWRRSETSSRPQP